MALHRVTQKRDDAYTDMYALIHDKLTLDGNASQNLATFCTTWADDRVHRLMDECLNKNMIDKDEYPQTAEIESRCVHMLADLWHSPEAADTIGCSTTGSSEASMLGGLALKWRWRLKRQAEGKPTDKPNLVCGPVQICWDKFARYFDVELRQVPLLPDATGLDVPIVIPGGKTGLWAVAGIGFAAVAFALVLSFAPPDQLPIGNSATYIGLVAAGLIVFTVLPLAIYQRRKPSWRSDVASQLAEV